MIKPLTFVFTAGILFSGTAQTADAPIPDPPPWCDASLLSSPLIVAEYANTSVQGAATFRMGADGVFDRPIILVEGFDLGTGWNESEWGFGQLTWSRIHGTHPIEFAPGLDYRLLLDDLHEFGADLIFLDFEHGAASLHAKAALLTHLLTLVEEHKVGDFPGVVVGVSMGGVVARMAIKQWENTGSAHCIGQYYSVDAPHLGATLPVGLQSLILGLSATSETALSLWNALNSSAAHELVQHHISSSGAFHEIQNDLLELGWPQRTLNFNVINSSESATASFTDDPLLRIEWGLEWPFETPTCFVKAERWSASEAESSASYVLPGNLFDLSGTSPFAVGLLSFAQPTENPETVAGSEARHIQDLAAALTESVPLPVLESSVQSQATFIPYESALGQSPGLLSPWTDISTSTAAVPREAHAALPPHHRNWMWPWITSIWEESHPWNHIHSEENSVTLGWQQPRIRTLRGGLVSLEGQIVVGNSDVPFEVRTSPCEGELLIESGGQLLVGNQTNIRGKVRIGSGTNVCIGMSGTLEIHEGSKVIVERHGALRLDGGQVIIHEGGALVIEKNGQCVVSGESTIELEATGSICHIDGDVILHQGVELNVSNRGTLQCEDGSQVTLDEGSLLYLEQDDSGQMLVSGQCVLAGSGQFQLHHGIVHFLPTGTIQANASSRWENVTMVTDCASANHVISRAAATIEDCLLSHIHWVHENDANAPALFKVLASEWNHGACSIKGARIRLSNSEFFHCFIEGEEMVSPSRFIGNRFEAPWYESCPSLRLTGSSDQVWLENNTWQGGNGLVLMNCPLVASCNTWQDCQTAIQLNEGTFFCLTPICGGGGNRFLENNIHFVLDGAPLPVMDFGNNHMGTASNVVISGETSSIQPSWVIKGASWEASMLQNPWFSGFPSNLMNCSSGTCTVVPCFAQDMTAESSCGESGGERPHSTKSQPLLYWNVLGQEVSLPKHAVNAAD